MRVANVWCVAAAAAVVSSCLMSPPIRFGSGLKDNDEAQHADLSRLMPTAVDLDHPFAGEVRTVLVHVWADDEYRAQNLHWQQTFQRDLDDFNAVAAALFGIELEPEYHVWDRHEPGAELQAGLAELAALDPDRKPFAVIGLTSALSIVSENAEYLGYATEPGRYIMLRGWAAAVERGAFEAAFHDLDAEERDSVLEARRRHKAVTVMLHELGHNLGAPHETVVADSIMNPSVSLHAASFTPDTRDRLQHAVDLRLGRPSTTTVATTGGAVAKHASVVLVVTPSGQIVFAGQPIDAGTVGELLKRSAADDPQTEVVVRFGRDAPTATISQITASANAAGLHRVSIEPN